MHSEAGMPKHTYIAQSFRQRADSKTELLLFIAPAGELKKWAGVPRKTFDYQTASREHSIQSA